MDPENSWLVAEIAKQYFYLQEYTASKTYALEAINIDSENFIAQDLLNKLEEIQLPEACLLYTSSEARYFPNTIPPTLTGDVISNTSVPLFLSSAKALIVNVGKINISKKLY